MKKMKLVAMAVMCFVAIVANAQVVKRDTVVVNQKEYVFIKDSLSNKEIVKMLENEDSIMVLTNESSLNDTTCYVYDLYAKEGSKIIRYKNNELRIASSSRKPDVLSDVLKDDSWKTQKPVGLSDNLYVDGLKTQNVAKKNADKDRDAYVAVVNGMPVELQSRNRYGWSLTPFVGYQFTSNLNSFTVGAAAEFSQRWGFLSAQAEYGKSKFSEFSQNPGKEYGTFRTEFRVGWKPFKIDQFDTHRVTLTAGFGFEYYGTDSPVHDGGWIQSWGNVLYPTAGIQYENRGFNRGYSWSFLLQWRALNSVVQNDELVTKHAIVGTLRVPIHIFRNIVKNVPKKKIKEWQRNY
jgi:hypothetical protein